jgi:hypothetical protein
VGSTMCASFVSPVTGFLRPVSWTLILFPTLSVELVPFGSNSTLSHRECPRFETALAVSHCRPGTTP